MSVTYSNNGTTVTFQGTGTLYSTTVSNNLSGATVVIIEGYDSIGNDA